MSTVAEIGSDKQTIEGSLYTLHTRLKAYTNDQISILDDIMSIIETFYKTEKHTHEKMQGSLQKSLEHAQNMSYLGSSVIGSSWSAAINELMEHYSQRAASYPVLKQVVLENLRKIKNEKLDEYNKVLLYDEEISKEMVEIERRVIKLKRAYDESCERFRQKDSGIKRIHQKISLKNEQEKLEIALVDNRNMYILQVNLMNYALKFYIEQFIIDLDKLLVCDLFPQINQALDDLVYSEYKRLRDTLQRAMQAAVGDGDEQKKHLLPKSFQTYPLMLAPDQSDQIITDERCLPQFSSIYFAALNDVREADQQIQLALESSVLNAQQNKDSRMDTGKIRLKRMEMRKSMATFLIDTLETLIPNIKTAPTSVRPSKLMGGLKPFILAPKSDTNSTSVPTSTNGSPTTGTLVDIDSTQSYLTSTSTIIYPCHAVVLYDFEALNDDEMSVRKDDKIFIESKPEYEGWLVARGRDRSGLVPESYVQMVPPLTASTEPGLTKPSKNKSSRKKKTSINDSSSNNSLSTVIDNEDDYFSDD